MAQEQTPGKSHCVWTRRAEGSCPYCCETPHVWGKVICARLSDPDCSGSDLQSPLVGIATEQLGGRARHCANADVGLWKHFGMNSGIFSQKVYRGNLCKTPDNLQLGESKYITNCRGNGQNTLISVLKDCADAIAVKEMSKETSQVQWLFWWMSQFLLQPAMLWSTLWESEVGHCQNWFLKITCYMKCQKSAVVRTCTFCYSSILWLEKERFFLPFNRLEAGRIKNFFFCLDSNIKEFTKISEPTITQNTFCCEESTCYTYSVPVTSC